MEGTKKKKGGGGVTAQWVSGGSADRSEKVML